MKKTILSMAMLLTLSATVPALAQKHRHTPRTQMVDKQKDTKADAANAASQEDEGIEAYSDTTSTDNDSASVTNMPGWNSQNVDDTNDLDPSRFGDPFSWLSHMFTTAFGGFLGTIIILAFLLFFFMPLIIVLLIIRYFVRRHKDRVRLAEMAMEKGIPLTEEQTPLTEKQNPLLKSRAEYMWRRGVKNTSTGVGLMILFWCLGANPLIGIGGLVACIGLGQMFMVKYNYDSKLTWKRKNEETYEEPLYSDIADTTENNEENGEERNNPNETNR